MNGHERLQNAAKASREGRHEEALQEFIWFHHHALEEEPSLYGVRLSFALGYWTELGQVYPKALDALRAIRKDKAEALLRGDAGLEWFRDVMAIDRELGNTTLTYQLYVALAESCPALATECARAALPAIVAAKDYALAACLMPPPEPLLRQRAIMLEHDIGRIKHRAVTRAPARWATIFNYVDEVKRLVTILAGNEDFAEATRINALAISVIKSPSVRRDVAAQFIKPSKPPRSSRR
ncbi:hypothetical protein PO883_24580 [Massilia sp. DJPM01]|uniref:hypothetical protein n=1 Tax=Massilia sp. DJPM01 TaxID=3024404 RepID=UPI00259DBFF7|nr:hypothetical protein [Massilia sp. DJPM01]MDM5180363.1 hypothetical protein [Massilia sp. DJPM01]